MRRPRLAAPCSGKAGDLRRDREHHVHVVHVLRLLVGVAGVVGVVVVPVALVDAGAVGRRHRAWLPAAGSSAFEFLGPAPSSGAEAVAARTAQVQSAGVGAERRYRAQAQGAGTERGCELRSIITF